MNNARLWTIEDVAEFLAIPPQTLYRWNYLGTGPRRIKVGRYVRYRPEDVEAWLEEQRIQDRAWS
jgi:predicted DNA-binding transcriptional regulator AlpA